MERIELKKIKVEDVYVSVLSRKRVANAEGWTRMEEVSKRFAPTGSIVIDAVGRVLAADSGVDSVGLAAALGVPSSALNTILKTLTGLKTCEFIKSYRLLRAREWIVCTDLELRQVAARSGFPTQGSFNRSFTEQFGQTPRDYRRQNRPANFRELYEWQ